MSTKLMRVMERARTNPYARFNSLAHLLDEDTLRRAYQRIRRNAAVGVDGMDKQTCPDSNLENKGEIELAQVCDDVVNGSLMDVASFAPKTLSTGASGRVGNRP